MQEEAEHWTEADFQQIVKLKTTQGRGCVEDKNELEIADGGQWNMEKPRSLSMHLYTHAHRYGFIQVLFTGLASLQRRDKGLEGEKNNQKKEEWIEY